ncbi:MAG: histidine phosphatase super family protein, partial [Rubritepida sp.]|nr:histidine phosphatase super family protein [Rubritepida sp.]
RSDAGLSTAGGQSARRLANAVEVQDFDRVIASPARRARYLGGLLARRRGVALTIEPLLAERDFGSWEGRGWDPIWQAEGNSMDGMLDAPGSFRPGGGETTCELAARALEWWRNFEGTSLVVAHGGPIGALAGSLLHDPPRAWLAYVPRPGEGILITPRSITSWRQDP